MTTTKQLSALIANYKRQLKAEARMNGLSTDFGSNEVREVNRLARQLDCDYGCKNVFQIAQRFSEWTESYEGLRV